MPLAPPTVAGVIIPSLVANAQLGIAVPQLALGVATGMSILAKSSTVVSADVGTFAPGVTAIPFVVPPPLLLASFLTTFPAAGVAGVMMPLLANGLATGMSLGFLQGIVTMAHAIVGAGVAKFIPAGAVPAFLSGFAAAGLTGVSAVQLATAIGLSLIKAFGPYLFPVPCLGVPSIVPGAAPSIIGVVL